MKQKILIVDDNPTNQVVLKLMLENNGFAVTVAEHGIEALLKVKSETFSHIFMDIHMPFMNGINAIKKIRETKQDKPIKIIAISADVFAENQESAISAGADHFLTKPITSKMIRAVL